GAIAILRRQAGRRREGLCGGDRRKEWRDLVTPSGLYNIADVHFEFLPLRFEFAAKEACFFPPGKAANALRGGLGTVFRRIACVPHCRDGQSCAIRESCPYARFFEPASAGGEPRGPRSCARLFG